MTALEFRKQKLETTTYIEPSVLRKPEIKVNENENTGAILLFSLLGLVGAVLTIWGIMVEQVGTLFLGLILMIFTFVVIFWLKQLTASEAQKRLGREERAADKEYEQKYKHYLQEYQDEKIGLL